MIGHYGAYASLKLSDPPTSVPPVLDLQACATTFTSTILKMIYRPAALAHAAIPATLKLKEKITNSMPAWTTQWDLVPR